MKANSLVLATLLAAMLLAIIPLPSWLMWLRPEFILLVLIYWVMAIPERFGLLAALLAGLFQDSFTGSVLGRHMLSYVIVIAIILFTYQRLRMFGVWQQALFLFGLLSLQQLTEAWVARFAGQPSAGAWIMLPALVGALIWPWLLVFLRGLRRKAGVMNRII